MPRDSSSTPVTILWVNYYEMCCIGSLLSMVEGRALMGAEVLRYD
jgi:hypothetical protein